MSLTSFLQQKDVQSKFKEEIILPKIELKGDLLAPPKTTNYGLIGTAYDYLLRFLIKKKNKSAIENAWIAEKAIKKIQDLIKNSKDSTESYKKLIEILEKTVNFSKAIYRDYTKYGSDNLLIETCIALAQIDPIFRAFYLDPNLGSLDKRDIEDLKKIKEITDLKLFKSEKSCYLNPNFGEASQIIGGAEADLIIDDCIIEIKTIKELKLKREHINQLVGYYLLSLIGKVNGEKEKKDIKDLGVYFSRYNILCKFSINDVLVNKNYQPFLKWFEKRIKERNY